MTAATSATPDDPPPDGDRDILADVIQKYLAWREIAGQTPGAARRELAQWICVASHSEDQLAEALRDLLDRRSLEAKGAGPVLIGLDTVTPEEVDWVTAGWVPRGKVTQLSGDPKLGKSMLTLSLAAAVSTGSAWPTETGVPTQRASVIILSAEDDPADTIVPRLVTLGADLTRIKLLRGVRRSADSHEAPLLLDEDLLHLETAIREIGDVGLVIIDPMLAYTGQVDTYKTSEVRALLARLAALASRHKVAVLVVNHLNKSPGGPAVYRSMGSLAFAAAARMLLTVAKDKENPARRLLLRDGNLTPPGAAGLAFSIESDPATGAPTIAWETEGVNVTADEALQYEPPERSSTSELDRAVSWLRNRLAGGPSEANEVLADADEADLAERTIERAKKVLRVRSRPRGSGPSRAWYWELPGEDAPPPAGTPETGGPDGDGLGGPGGVGGDGDLDGLGGEEKKEGRQDRQESQRRQGNQTQGLGGEHRQDRQGSHERQGCQDGLFAEEPAFHDDGSDVDRG